MLSDYRQPHDLKDLLVLDLVIHSLQIPILRRKLSGQPRGSAVGYLVILDLAIHSIPRLRPKPMLIDYPRLNWRFLKLPHQRLLRTIRMTHSNRGIHLLNPSLGPLISFRH